jgi:hypothetical protein
LTLGLADPRGEAVAGVRVRLFEGADARDAFRELGGVRVKAAAAKGRRVSRLAMLVMNALVYSCGRRNDVMWPSRDRKSRFYSGPTSGWASSLSNASCSSPRIPPILGPARGEAVAGVRVPLIDDA